MLFPFSLSRGQRSLHAFTGIPEIAVNFRQTDRVRRGRRSGTARFRRITHRFHSFILASKPKGLYASCCPAPVPNFQHARESASRQLAIQIASHRVARPQKTIGSRRCSVAIAIPANAIDLWVRMSRLLRMTISQFYLVDSIPSSAVKGILSSPCQQIEGSVSFAFAFTGTVSSDRICLSICGHQVICCPL